MLCTGDTAATFTISDIVLEYDAIINVAYTKKVSRAQQNLSKTFFAYKVENFYNPTIKKVNVAIDGDPHQLFKGSILPRNMYQEIGKRFFRENPTCHLKST